MEEDRFNCKNCGANVFEDEMLEKNGFCPKCGKREGWISDPVFIGF